MSDSEVTPGRASTHSDPKGFIISRLWGSKSKSRRREQTPEIDIDNRLHFVYSTVQVIPR
jgi:hypothetical protein